jgi:aspartate beta-hydroxylase
MGHAMLFEFGRKHQESCALVPATTQLIESDPTTLTPAGLIYVSRMAPGTHVAPHRGPTNTPLRCDLSV